MGKNPPQPWRGATASLMVAALAACQPTPAATPTPTATARPVTATLSEADALQTARAVALATFQVERAATQAAASPPPLQTPTPTPTPTPILTPLAPSISDSELPEEAVARLGAGAFRARALSPDGAHLVIARNDGLFLYRAETLEALWQTDLAGNVTWLADGENVAIGSTVYAIPTGEGVATLPLEASFVTWSPDGSRAATYARDGSVVIWDAADGEILWRAARPVEGALQGDYLGWRVRLAFSPDGSFLAATYTWSRADIVYANNRVFLWDARSGQSLLELEGSVEDGRFFFSPDSRQIAYAPAPASAERGATVWRIDGGRRTARIDDASAFAWSPDGRRFAAAGGQTVALWDAETGDAIRVLPAQTAVAQVVWSSDGSLLAASPYDFGPVEVWDADSGQSILRLDQAGPVVGFGPDGRTLLAGLGSRGSVGVWDLASAGSAAAPTVYLKGSAPLTGLDWSPDGSALAASYGIFQNPPSLIVWQAATAAPRLILEEPALSQGSAPSLIDLLGVDWSPDGGRLLTASWDAGVSIWDAATGLPLLALDAAPLARFSPDGSRLLTTDEDDLTVWSAETGRRLFAADTGFGGRIMDAAWSPDGTRIAAAWTAYDDALATDSAGLALVWDARLESLAALEGLGGPALSIAWSPDGSRLAAGSNARAAIWAANQPGAPPQLILYSNLDQGDSPLALTDLEWSPDGARVAAALGLPLTRLYCNGCGYADPGLVLMWDAFTAERVARFDAHLYEVQAVAFSPDGSLVASGSLDGTIILWNLLAEESEQP